MPEQVFTERSLFPDIVEDRPLGETVTTVDEAMASLAEVGLTIDVERSVTHFGRVETHTVYRQILQNTDAAVVISPPHISGFGDEEYWVKQSQAPSSEQLTGYIHATQFVQVDGRQELAVRITDAITDVVEHTERLILVGDISAISTLAPQVSRWLVQVENGLVDSVADEAEFYNEWHEFFIHYISDKPDYRCIWRNGVAYQPWDTV